MAPLTDIESHYWRTDVKIGRSVYALISNNVLTPSQYDPLVGTMESSELAQNVVDVHNRVITKYGRHYLQALATDD